MTALARFEMVDGYVVDLESKEQVQAFLDAVAGYSVDLTKGQTWGFGCICPLSWTNADLDGLGIKRVRWIDQKHAGTVEVDCVLDKHIVDKVVDQVKKLIDHTTVNPATLKFHVKTGSNGRALVFMKSNTQQIQLHWYFANRFHHGEQLVLYLANIDWVKYKNEQAQTA